MHQHHGTSLDDEQDLAERIVRGAIRSYRLYPFDRVDAGIVAEVTGVDVDVVTRLFPTWEALLLVTYDRWVQLRGTRRSKQPTCTIDHVRMTLVEDIADPGLVRVLAGVITYAAAETGFAELFRKRFEEYVEQLSTGLERDAAIGSERLTIPAHQAATQLLAVYEGLQIQMLVRPHVDVLVEFDRAVRTLRQGWREREVAAWDIDVAALTAEVDGARAVEVDGVLAAEVGGVLAAEVGGQPGDTTIVTTEVDGQPGDATTQSA